jgi:hypothetical protein
VAVAADAEAAPGQPVEVRRRLRVRLERRPLARSPAEVVVQQARAPAAQVAVVVDEAAALGAEERHRQRARLRRILA